MKVIKTILINIAVLLGLLFCVNLVVISIYQLRSATEDKSDLRGSLPNYKDISWAKKHFEEFNQLKSDYKSYVGWRRPAFKGETVNIDEKGIRYTPQSPNINDSSAMVVFLGGSTMWGTGTDDAHTIPALFAQHGEGKYRVLNLGEAGYRSQQEAYLLNLQLNQGLTPKIVVSYDGVNELAGFRNELSDVYAHQYETVFRQAIISQRSGNNKELSFSGFFFGPVQAALGMWLKGKQTKSTDFYDLSAQRTEAVAKALLDSWMLTLTLAESKGAYFLAILQPNVKTGTPKTDHLKLDQIHLKPYELLYPAIVKMLEQPAYQPLKGHFLDLTQALNVQEPVYIDFCHLSPNGNQIIANKIYDHLQKIQK